MPAARLFAFVALFALAGCPAHIHREVCERYIACATAVDPAAAAPVALTYGSESACWSDDRQARACVEGCAVGIESLKANGFKCEEEKTDAR